ncbi:30S ribosomal protein S6 [Buchnera aphidicola]|uniref:30S ribosomal protein S6 n=1 Tax=Buchnera aphidicola TaxID=9 RepID=UPI0034641F79
MRHYEIIFMIHPDQTSEQVLKIVNNYKEFIKKNHGLVHRLEDWGRRQLSYKINKLQKAYYILLNVELSPKIIIILKDKFRFDNVVIRNLILQLKNKVVTMSPVLKLKDEKNKSL